MGIWFCWPEICKHTLKVSEQGYETNTTASCSQYLIKVYSGHFFDEIAPNQFLHIEEWEANGNPIWIFLLARELHIGFMLWQGTFQPRVTAASALSVLKSTLLSEKEWFKQWQFHNIPWIHPCPYRGSQAMAISASTGWEKIPGELWHFLHSSLLFKTSLCDPVYDISAQKRR